MANKVNSDQLRQTLMQDLLSARKQTDRLFQMLSPAALNERPIPERHRIIFYLGHLEAFDWNMIGTWAFHKPSFNSGFDRLFAFGIDPVDGQLPDDKPSDWPQVEEIGAYRDKIRAAIDSLLGIADFVQTRRKTVAAQLKAETLGKSGVDFTSKRWSLSGSGSNG